MGKASFLSPGTGPVDSPAFYPHTENLSTCPPLPFFPLSGILCSVDRESEGSRTMETPAFRRGNRLLVQRTPARPPPGRICRLAHALLAAPLLDPQGPGRGIHGRIPGFRLRHGPWRRHPGRRRGAGHAGAPARCPPDRGAPCPGQEARWPLADKERYRTLLAQAGLCVTACPHTPPMPCMPATAGWWSTRPASSRFSTVRLAAPPTPSGSRETRGLDICFLSPRQPGSLRPVLAGSVVSGNRKAPSKSEGAFVIFS